MKTKLFSLFLALVASVGIAFASDTEVDGIWYNFNSSTLTAEVTYRGGTYYSYWNEYSGVVSIPTFVTYGGKTYSVTSIEEYTFSGCSSLTSITIPNSVTLVGKEAFRGCSSVTSITIGENVSEIKNLTYYECPKLESVTCKRRTPPTLEGSYVFDYNGHIMQYECDRLYVPAESVDAYRNAGGWKYFNFIRAITEDAIEEVLSDEAQSTKVLRDGNVYILHDGKTYTVEGQEVR